MRAVWMAGACALGMVGCAKDAEMIAPAYVSPITYQNFTCAQIGEEAQRVADRAAGISGLQDRKATTDRVVMGVGLVVFWPAMLLTKGNDETAGEIARLKGSMEALEQASIRKNCGIVFKHPPPPQPTLQANGDYR